MRMWMVDPRIMCRRHLLGEHLETHMFVGAIKKGFSIDGYIRNNCCEPKSIQKRHNVLAKEMERRGYNHKSNMEFHCNKKGTVNPEKSLKDLVSRCRECAKRVKELT